MAMTAKPPDSAHQDAVADMVARRIVSTGMFDDEEVEALAQAVLDMQERINLHVKQEKMILDDREAAHSALADEHAQVTALRTALRLVVGVYERCGARGGDEGYFHAFREVHDIVEEALRRPT